MMKLSPRRSTLRLLLAIGLTAGVVALVAAPAPAAADSRDDARVNYEQGKKMYAAGDYKGAIAAFARAEQLAPSPYNDFNIALAYDKLGEADIAVQYYRSYLAKAPDAPNKAAVEASIARLDAAAKAAAAKAEEARRAADARRAEEQRIEDQRREDDRRADAEEARRAEDARRAEEQRLSDELARRAEEQRRNGTTGAGAYGTGPVTGPGTGTGAGPVARTGDPELDRVQGIDVNGVRAQNGGFEGSAPATGAGPAVAGTNPNAAPTQPTTGAALDPNAPTDQPKPKKAIYKQWWFWVVVGVSAYVLVSIALADGPNNSGREAARLQPRDPDGADDVERRWTVLPEIRGDMRGGGGGATVLRW